MNDDKIARNIVDCVMTGQQWKIIFNFCHFSANEHEKKIVCVFIELLSKHNQLK